MILVGISHSDEGSAESVVLRFVRALFEEAGGAVGRPDQARLRVNRRLALNAEIPSRRTILPPHGLSQRNSKISCGNVPRRIQKHLLITGVSLPGRVRD